MKEEMKHNLIIAVFTPVFWPFEPTSCFLLELCYMQVEENVCVTEKWVLRMTAETQVGSTETRVEYLRRS